MTTITEETLHGDWFHLEEQQPLDPAWASYYTLTHGEVSWGPMREIVGSYKIEGGRAVITFLQTTAANVTIVLSGMVGSASDSSDWIKADATYEMAVGRDAQQVYGSFVRRIVDFPSIEEILHRAE